MTALKTLRHAAAALALGALGIAFVPAAHAVGIASYAANALVQVTLLTDVAALGPDVTVTYESKVDGQSASAAGTTSFAVASPSIWPGQPPLTMGQYDSLELDHITIGEAGAPTGSAFSNLLSSGYISMANNSTSPVDLVFELFIDAAATGASVGVSGNPGFASAFANVMVEMFDYLNLNVFQDLNASLASGVPNDPATALLQNYTVTLAPGDNNEISVLVSTSGGATFVPEPASLALMVAGLLGAGSVRRRAAA